jgi:hypothetical protein
MRPRLLLGVLAVVLLILAIWLVPMALAAAGGSAGSPDSSGRAQAPSGTECPFLQAHPWLDPHGSADGAGGPAATSGANGQIDYY